MYPSYRKLYSSGELKDRIKKAYDILKSCALCPRNCKVNRLDGKIGFCKGRLLPKISTYLVHHREEPPISGKRGSGAIFFAFCVGRCLFCQNYKFSHNGFGKEIQPEELAEMMIDLQSRGCHNINLVTPTHYVPQILAALHIASGCGLNIPLVYNSGGYESIETLKLLDGIVDIYLPDAKYANDKAANELSEFKDYVNVNRPALKEMYRQVGDLATDSDGIAKRGLIIRHLILPNNLSQTKQVLNFISDDLSKTVYVSIMDQYHPVKDAFKNPLVNRRITKEEYREAFKTLIQSGLNNGWMQEDSIS